MKFKLTKYGRPHTTILPIVLIAAMFISLLAGKTVLLPQAVYPIEATLLIALIAVLAFFRDPHRLPPADGNLLLAPADGKITDIELIQENTFINAPALRIGIFLSIFDVHINRAPCNAKVETVLYKKGKFKDARNPNATKLNESNSIGLIRTDSPQDKLIVRQISGAIARRIVCDTNPGENLTGGQKFGMIKFGSRTELYLPARKNVNTLVKIGDKVKAGLTPLVRYQ